MILMLIGAGVAIGGKLADRVLGRSQPMEFKGSTIPPGMKR